MTQPFNELSDTMLDALIARERERAGAPLTEWSLLSARLREEGLIHSSGEPAPLAAQSAAEARPERGVSRGADLPWQMRHVDGWRRVVAGAALLGLGMVIGAGSRIVATVEKHVQTNAAQTVASNDTTRGNSIDAAIRPVENSEPPFASPEEAKQVLLKAQNDYQRAAAYLAASDTSAQIVGVSHNPEVYQQRLAALDAVASATRRALKESPHDPLLHQYYQSTMGAREATEQQLAQAIPVGMQVSRF
jgi:hypothetical protein